MVGLLMARITQAERNKARNFGYGLPKPSNKPPGAGKKPPLSANAWAQREAQRYIDAQIKAIQESQKIYLDELNRQAQERVKQGQNLASWLQGQNFPGRIQGIYQTAGSDIAGYGQGFATDIRDIASADAATQANLVSGTGQEGAVRNEGAGMGDVIYGAYGWSPARKFAETGAAFASDAALQPSFAARFAADEAMKLQQEGLGGLKDFALQMAEARSGKYEVVQNLLAQRQQAKDDRFKRYMQLAALEMQRGNAARANMYLKLAMQDNSLASRKQQVAEYAAQGYAPDGKTLLPGWKRSPAGNVPPGYVYNPKTRQIEKAKTSSSGGKKPVDWGDLQGDMATYTDKFYKTVPVPGALPGMPGSTQKVRWSREEAYKALWARFAGEVKDKLRLRRLINEILDLKGFKKEAPASTKPGR